MVYILLPDPQRRLNKFMVHTVSNPRINDYVFKEGGRIASLPVCPKCERVGARDKGWTLNKIMSCPHCGYHGPATHQLSAYLKEEGYR
jgi:hypothetical protein